MRKVIAMNDYQKDRFTKNMVHRMFNTISGKKIGVLGFAFKKDTGDTRESPAAFVCKALIDEGARVQLYDPQVKREQMFVEFDYTCGLNNSTMPGLDKMITTCPDAYTASSEAHALAVLTEWDEFKDLDFELIYKKMAKPAFVFDGRNLLDHDKLRSIGFEVYAIGKPIPKKPFA
ncbi:unnamed protein product [Choristocarpus tenellus]